MSTPPLSHMWALERCPSCKGTGTLGRDGHGHHYICWQCEGDQVLWVPRQAVP